MVQFFENFSTDTTANVQVDTTTIVPDYVTDCVIVGTGPSGGSLASFLGSYGVKGILISKLSTTAQTPRAHITNMATMECMRDIGIEQKCRSSGLDWSHMTHVHWSESLSGKEYARLPSWGNGPNETKYEAASPCLPMDLPQNVLEPILVQKAMSSDFVVRFNTEFLSFIEDESRGIVRVQVKDHIFGNVYIIQCRYLFGCDGSHSRVLKQLGIPVAAGKGAGVQSWDVLIRADLSHLMKLRQGNLHWTFQEDHLYPGRLLVVHPRMSKPWTEWVVGFSWAPGSEPDSDIVPTSKDWIKRLRVMTGDENIDIEILDIVSWEMNNAVAERSSKGRIFCLGDAVHRHSPGGALGSNTAIQDSYNLAWKVAYVLKGQAGPHLLETYSTERNPVGSQAASSSMDAVFANLMIMESMGVRKGNLDGLKDHQKKLAENSDEGRRLRAKMRQALENSKFGIEGLGVEMNQRYQSSAVWIRNNDIPPAMPEPRLNYYKTTYPGARLPHAWLNTSVPSKPVSTLDLAGHGRFTIFTGIGGEPWKTSAAQIEERLNLSIAVFSIGYGQDYEDPYFEWESCREIGESGAILVRPDRFVAWRSESVEPKCESTLLAVLERILSLRNIE